MNPFVSMKCIPNFIVIAIPEVTRTKSRRQNAHQMLKYKAYQASIEEKVIF